MTVTRIAGIVAAHADLGSMLDDVGAGARAGHGRPERQAHLENGLALGGYSSGEPAIASDGRHVVAFDGAIHNRHELWACTERDTVGTDAALLCALVGQRGPVGALDRCNGEFAAAIWARHERELWLARDRLGVRPLYYAQGNGRFAFASRPRPLLRLDWVSKEVDKAFVGRFAGSHYRTFDNDPTRRPTVTSPSCRPHILRSHQRRPVRSSAGGLSGSCRISRQIRARARRRATANCCSTPSGCA